MDPIVNSKIDHELERQFQELMDKAKELYPNLEGQIAAYAGGQETLMQFQEQIYMNALYPQSTASNGIIA